MRAAILLVAIGACNGDEPSPPSCEARFFCDGDHVMQCVVRCVDGGCAREETMVMDCAAHGAALGVAKTCGEPAQCVDAQPVECSPPGSVSCSPVETAYRVCTVFAAGTFWDSRPLGQFCPTAGQLCHPAEMGIFCYTPPGEPCAQGTMNTCDVDGVTLVRCEGTPDSGYLVTRFTCPGACGFDGMGRAACL